MSKQKPTVAYRLFHEIFQVGIPNKFLWTEGHLKRVPGLQTADEDRNRQLLNEITVVGRTPVALVLLYDRGIDPIFQNRNDVLTVYNLLTQHLNRWSEIISNPISGRLPPPAEELLIMENFTHFLYEDAEFERETLEAKGKLVKREGSLDDFFAMFGGRSHRRNVTQLTQLTTPAQEPQNHGSMIGSNIQTAWDNSPWSLINGNSRHPR